MERCVFEVHWYRIEKVEISFEGMMRSCIAKVQYSIDPPLPSSIVFLSSGIVASFICIRPFVRNDRSSRGCVQT